MKVVCIIPARFNSQRFPGKMLAVIDGKSMIQRVYEQAAKAKRIDRVIVATDDERIIGAVKEFGGESVMTPECRSGTDRVAVVAEKLDTDIVVNVQGDEPLLQTEVIDGTAGLLMDDGTIDMATAAVPIDDPVLIKDENTVKVAVDKACFAVDFSRSAISADGETGEDGNGNSSFLKHIGIYAYRKKFLAEFVKMQTSPREKTERLEQLRAIENDCRIKVMISDKDSIGVDVQEDIRKVEDELNKRSNIEKRD